VHLFVHLFQLNYDQMEYKRHADPYKEMMSDLFVDYLPFTQLTRVVLFYSTQKVIAMFTKFHY